MGHALLEVARELDGIPAVRREPLRAPSADDGTSLDQRGRIHLHSHLASRGCVYRLERYRTHRGKKILPFLMKTRFILLKAP
jgi:hypothetical protein